MPERSESNCEQLEYDVLQPNWQSQDDDGGVCCFYVAQRKNT